MATEKFKVQNVKCGGCVSNIRNGLLEIPGIERVEVEIEGGAVTVETSGPTREQLSAKLAQLGYPEA